MHCLPHSPHIFFFYHTATTEIYTLSLHDALPISRGPPELPGARRTSAWMKRRPPGRAGPSACTTPAVSRSEEHTSELQSLRHLVCRLLLEKKKTEEP